MHSLRVIPISFKIFDVGHTLEKWNLKPIGVYDVTPTIVETWHSVTSFPRLLFLVNQSEEEQCFMFAVYLLKWLYKVSKHTPLNTDKGVWKIVQCFSALTQ